MIKRGSAIYGLKATHLRTGEVVTEADLNVQLNELVSRSVCLDAGDRLDPCTAPAKQEINNSISWMENHTGKGHYDSEESGNMMGSIVMWDGGFSLQAYNEQNDVHCRSAFQCGYIKCTCNTGFNVIRQTLHQLFQNQGTHTSQFILNLKPVMTHGKLVFSKEYLRSVVIHCILSQ